MVLPRGNPWIITDIFMGETFPGGDVSGSRKFTMTCLGLAIGQGAGVNVFILMIVPVEVWYGFECYCQGYQVHEHSCLRLAYSRQRSGN